MGGLTAPSLPSAEDLAGQMLVDPGAAERLQVDYLGTSWRDTEGTWQTLDGLAEITGHAQAPGRAGEEPAWRWIGSTRR